MVAKVAYTAVAQEGALAADRDDELYLFIRSTLEVITTISPWTH